MDGLNDAIAIVRGEADPSTYRVHRVPTDAFRRMVETCKNAPEPSEGLKRLMRGAGKRKGAPQPKPRGA